MKISKILHRNEWRIRVDFPYNSAKVAQLRQVEDARLIQEIKSESGFTEF